MRKIVGAIITAAVMLPSLAIAGTPQQNLHAHLLDQVRKSWECRGRSTNRYCNPAPVTGSARDATLALQHMLNVERLGILCAARDSNACLRQGAIRAEASKLGWCLVPTMGWNDENVLLWYRCEKPVSYSPDRN